jgi:nucleoside-diphosphate-sugar epimerase
MNEPIIYIVGHKGYIGSYLCQNISGNKILVPTRGKDAADIGLADVVIYLGGKVGHQ